MRVSLVFVGRDLKMPDGTDYPDGRVPRSAATRLEIIPGIVHGEQDAWLRIDGMPLGQLVGVVVDHLDTEREIPPA